MINKVQKGLFHTAMGRNSPWKHKGDAVNRMKRIRRETNIKFLESTRLMLRHFLNRIFMGRTLLVAFFHLVLV